MKWVREHVEAKRVRKMTLSKPLGLAVNGQGRAMEKGGDQPLQCECEAGLGGIF